MSEPSTNSQHLAIMPKHSCASYSFPAKEQRGNLKQQENLVQHLLAVPWGCHEAQLLLHHHPVQAYSLTRAHLQPLMPVDLSMDSQAASACGEP